ncbi:competence protein ComEC [Desulfonispora thiosulfatigenes DSM 11270]|uniref:Competence protein ComEC n=1 Tax=Desulfonispora thiosulfatigenes DSM 11270 TaxID=656914 RepID=A0A1W1VA05_DESTI|nr:ComEC/Rec2 family competence protein [Desulfonispora thiosulfatigenes]SMB90297.1 competence protein ComEC [Desulfonispora thiosulfatigenes DSM 11270]
MGININMKRLFLIILFLVSTLFIGCVQLGGNNESSKFKVHFIDVGQADCILVQDGNSSMLIDAGNNGDADLVVDYIKRQKIDKLNYVIGTHPHEDHIGGLDAVIYNFPIDNLYMPKVSHTTKTFKDVIKAVKDKGLKVKTPLPGTNLNLNTAKVTILAPNSSSYEELNNYSIVVKVEYGDSSFLFTGDAEEISENEMVLNEYNLSADVLKVGHHGSHSSTTPEFLNKVNPKHAVIMVGKDNKYGHPHQESLDKLMDKNIKVYRTDVNGTIVATSDGKDISFGSN